MPTEPFNILLTCAGHRIERVKILRETLAELGLAGRIVAADASELSAAGQVADALVVLPRVSAADYTSALVEACRRESIRLVIPGIDPELSVLAAAREALANVGATALISAPEVIAIAADKQQTHRWLTENDFPTVRQTTPAAALADPTNWTFPLFGKPRGGSASVGVQRIATIDELRRIADLPEVIVQTIAQGDEYTVDVLVNRQGRAVAAVPRRRIEVRSGEVTKAVTVRQPAVIVLASRIAEALPGAYGPLNIQIFHEPSTDTLAVIEINPRFAGGFPLTHAAGGHFARWIIEEILGLPSTASNEHWQDGLVMLRYFDAVFTRILPT
jgi:carbamoyl-phosphate synthase large subunit